MQHDDNLTGAVSECWQLRVYSSLDFLAPLIIFQLLNKLWPPQIQLSVCREVLLQSGYSLILARGARRGQ